MTNPGDTNPADDPRFHDSLQNAFPGAIRLQDYLDQTCQALEKFGFERSNTLGVVASCRDEIAEPLLHEVIARWGKTFDFRSLGGFLFAGKSGVATVQSHAPIVAGKRRFVFYAMPHVAISREGEVGTVYRDGIGQVSHACGSLSTIVHELAAGKIDFHIDADDIEQCMVRQKILSALRYGDKPDHVGITKLACSIISDDMSRLQHAIACSPWNYAAFTGILIHGPGDTHWVCPHQAHVTDAGLTSPLPLPGRAET